MSSVAAAGIEADRQRRADEATQSEADIQWFIQEVTQSISLSMEQRVRVATELVKNRVIINISRPVTKTPSVLGIIVTDRSLPGEFPKADTTQLMKTVFSSLRRTPNTIRGYIGTPLDYGLKLELKMGRSFLVRTLNEERLNIERILTGPIYGEGLAGGFGIK